MSKNNVPVKTGISHRTLFKVIPPPTADVRTRYRSLRNLLTVPTILDVDMCFLNVPPNMKNLSAEVRAVSGLLTDCMDEKCRHPSLNLSRFRTDCWLWRRAKTCEYVLTGTTRLLDATCLELLDRMTLLEAFMQCSQNGLKRGKKCTGHSMCQSECFEQKERHLHSFQEVSVGHQGLNCIFQLQNTPISSLRPFFQLDSFVSLSRTQHKQRKNTLTQIFRTPLES